MIEPFDESEYMVPLPLSFYDKKDAFFMMILDLFILYTFSLAHFNSHSTQTITGKIGGGFCGSWLTGAQ